MALSMSAASGGGGGAAAGGAGVSAAAMAHQSNTAMAQARAHHQHRTQHQQTNIAAPPGTSGFAAGADQISDKRLAKLARGTKHMPLLCIDLYGCGHVAYNPPEVDIEGNEKTLSDPSKLIVPLSSKKLGCDVLLKANDDASYKSLRKLLTKGYGYGNVLSSHPISRSGLSQQQQQQQQEADSGVDKNVAVLTRPHSILGCRRVREINGTVLENYIIDESEEETLSDTQRVISESSNDGGTSSSSSNGGGGGDDDGGKNKDNNGGGVGGGIRVTLHGQSLDGGQANNDDYDRVAFHIPLHPRKKKPLSILPEEATGLLLAKAKKLVYAHYNKIHKQKELNDVNDDLYLGYPLTFPIPGYAMTDSLVESLLEGCRSVGGGGLDNASEYLLYPRSLCALVTSLRSLPTKNGSSPALRHVMTRHQLLMKRAQKNDLPSEGEHVDPLIVTVGTNMEEFGGYEVYAYQIVGRMNGQTFDIPYNSFRCIHSVCSRIPPPPMKTSPSSTDGDGGGTNNNKKNPTKDELVYDGIKKALQIVYKRLKSSLPGRVPCAFILYGEDIMHQRKLEKLVPKVWSQEREKDEKNDIITESEFGVLGNVHGPPPTVVTREDACCAGATLLATANTGRWSGLGSLLPCMHWPVATCALGMRIDYFGGDDDDDDDDSTTKNKNKNVDDDDDDDDDDDGNNNVVKVVFDFDRRLPAGPYQLDLSAAECAYARDHNGRLPPDGQEEECLKPYRGKDMVSKREEAAKALRIQMVQCCQPGRGGDGDGDDGGGDEEEWVNVGDIFRPLCMIKSGGGDGDGDGKEKKEDKGDGGEGEEDNESEEEDDNLVGCESSTLEISMSSAGVISTQITGDGESVVQATQTARSSTIKFYTGLAFCILFFGGFLIKSFIEDRVFTRDTKRLLEYYKHVIPGSMHDGDEHGARYLVYKYRHKKDKLWERLEKKYGVAVPDSWPEESGSDGDGDGDGDGEGEEEEVVELDKDNDKEEGDDISASGKEGEEKKKDDDDDDDDDAEQKEKKKKKKAHDDDEDEDEL